MTIFGKLALIVMIVRNINVLTKDSRKKKSKAKTILATVNFRLKVVNQAKQKH